MTNSGERAQVATEYLSMVGVLLIIIAILAAYAFFVYGETVSVKHVQNSLKDLKSAVNYAYASGKDTQLVVNITLPNDVVSSNISGHAIYITTTTFGINSQDFVEVDANVQGTLPTAPGIYEIMVHFDGNVATLTELP